MDNDTKTISTSVLLEIATALEDISYGSLEIIVQQGIVTQMTVRKIHKTSIGIKTKASRNRQNNGKTRVLLK